MDLALNNLQRLICHKTQKNKPNQTILNNYSICTYKKETQNYIIINFD